MKCWTCTYNNDGRGTKPHCSLCDKEYSSYQQGEEKPFTGSIIKKPRFTIEQQETLWDMLKMVRERKITDWTFRIMLDGFMSNL